MIEGVKSRFKSRRSGRPSATASLALPPRAARGRGCGRKDIFAFIRTRRMKQRVAGLAPAPSPSPRPSVVAVHPMFRPSPWLFVARERGRCGSVRPSF